MAMSKDWYSDRLHLVVSLDLSLMPCGRFVNGRRAASPLPSMNGRRSIGAKDIQKRKPSCLLRKMLRRPKHSEPGRRNSPVKRMTIGDTRMASRARTEGVPVDDIPVSSLPQHQAWHPAMPSHMHDKDRVSGIVRFWMLGQCRLAIHLLYIAFPVDLPTLDPDIVSNP